MRRYSERALSVCIICDWLWAIAMLGGCAYVVFGLGYSGWWFLVAIWLATMWNCKAYRSAEQSAADRREGE